MHPQLQSILDEAENRYLHLEELTVMSQYVNSLPERLEAYCSLRDQELDIMQWVADQLQMDLPQHQIQDLERSLKNALLMLRHCALGMLLNDEKFVEERVVSWLGQTMRVYDTSAIDAALYKLLNQRLNKTLSPKQMSFLKPMLLMIQTTLLQPADLALNNR